MEYQFVDLSFDAVTSFCWCGVFATHVLPHIFRIFCCALYMYDDLQVLVAIERTNLVDRSTNMEHEKGCAFSLVESVLSFGCPYLLVTFFLQSPTGQALQAPGVGAHTRAASCVTLDDPGMLLFCLDGLFGRHNDIARSSRVIQQSQKWLGTTKRIVIGGLPRWILPAWRCSCWDCPDQFLLGSGYLASKHDK